MYFYHSLLLTHIFELLHQHSNQLGKQEHKDLLSSQRMLIDFLDKQLRKFWWNNHRIILLGIFQCIVLFLGQQIIHHCRPKYSFLLCYYRNSWEQLDISSHIFQISVRRMFQEDSNIRISSFDHPQRFPWRLDMFLHKDLYYHLRNRSHQNQDSWLLPHILLINQHRSQDSRP